MSIFFAVLERIITNCKGEVLMTFGEKLKKKRIECCLTQNDLANKIHVSPSTISLYESDEREPTLSTLVAIANTLQVSSDYLLGLSEFTQGNGVREDYFKTLIEEMKKIISQKNPDIEKQKRKP